MRPQTNTDKPKLKNKHKQMFKITQHYNQKPTKQQNNKTQTNQQNHSPK